MRRQTGYIRLHQIGQDRTGADDVSMMDIDDVVPSHTCGVETQGLPGGNVQLLDDLGIVNVAGLASLRFGGRVNGQSLRKTGQD